MGARQRDVVWAFVLSRNSPGNRNHHQPETQTSNPSLVLLHSSLHAHPYSPHPGLNNVRARLAPVSAYHKRLCAYCRSHANRRHPNTTRNDTSLASSVLQLVLHAPTTYKTFVISVKLRRQCTSSHVALCSAQFRALPYAHDGGLSCPRSVSMQYSQYCLC